MAATIDATVGGADANSYVTQAEADTYFEGRLNADEWVSAAYPVEALITATRMLDEERWKGVRVNETQALQWPRYGVEKPDLAYSVLDGPTFMESTWYGTDEIPQRIKDAQCEVALWLLNEGTTDPTQPTGMEGFKNIRVGPLDATPNPARQTLRLPESVTRKIRPLLKAGDGGVRLLRG